MAMRAFGEMNVQTAKHYGNLGRLYQSMHRYLVGFLCPVNIKSSVDVELYICKGSKLYIIQRLLDCNDSKMNGVHSGLT